MLLNLVSYPSALFVKQRRKPKVDNESRCQPVCKELCRAAEADHQKEEKHAFARSRSWRRTAREKRCYFSAGHPLSHTDTHTHTADSGTNTSMRKLLAGTEHNEPGDIANEVYMRPWNKGTYINTDWPRVQSVGLRSVQFSLDRATVSYSSNGQFL